jgi:hypothetical protein
MWPYGNVLLEGHIRQVWLIYGNVDITRLKWKGFFSLFIANICFHLHFMGSGSKALREKQWHDENWPSL